MRFTLVALLYFLSGLAGLAVPYVGSNVTLIWPPTGIALAALIRYGNVHAPAVFVAALAVNLRMGSTLPMAALIAVGNTLGPLVGAWALSRKLSFSSELRRARDVWALFLVGGLGAMTLPPTLGALSLCLDGLVPWSAYGNVWTVWWLGDAIGVLFAAPPLLTASRAAWAALLRPGARGRYVLTVLAGCGLALGAFVLPDGAPVWNGAVAYLALAYLVWAAMRWNAFGSSLLLLIATAIAVTGTALGRGPFGELSPHLGLALLWSFIAAASLGSLLMLALQVERSAVEERLRESERKLSAVIGNLPGLVYRCLNDRDWTMMFVSDQAQAITGYTPAQLIAGEPTYSELIVDADRERVWEVVQRGVEERRMFQLEYRLRTADGRERWVFERGQPVIDERGECIALEGIVFDYTERKQIEEALLQSQKMDAVGRLAGGIAHDFNNLLVAIAGFAELIRRGTCESDPRKAHAEGVLHAAERAADLTRQLLAYSRKQRLSPQVFAINDAARNAYRLLERLLGENVRLDLELEATGAIDADPTQIEQVIMNLVLNARDAMPEGGVVKVRTEDVISCGDEPWTQGKLAAGRYEMLSVTDTGAGMPPEVLAHLFEPFFTTKDVGKGTGLGLATVYGVVKQSGGEILVSSEVGRGTTFRVVIARRELPAAEPARALEAPLRSANARELVLLIEDEPMVRALASDVLAYEGYRVLTAKDGREALEVAREHLTDIDVIVSDVLLPGASGPEIVRSLAQRRPGLRVLFMSGHPRDAAPQDVQGMVWDYLEKPFRPDQLTLSVRALLDRPQHVERSSLRSGTGG